MAGEIVVQNRDVREYFCFSCGQLRLSLDPKQNDCGYCSSKVVRWARVGELTGAFCLVEYMPKQFVNSHVEAGNWGIYPSNGSNREWMSAEDARELVDNDEHGYARVIRIRLIPKVEV